MKKRDGVKDAQELFELDQLYVDLRNKAQAFGETSEKYRNAFDGEWSKLINKRLDAAANKVTTESTNTKFKRGVVVGLAVAVVVHKTGLDRKLVEKAKKTKRQFILWSQS